MTLTPAVRDRDWRRATAERVARSVPTNWISAFVSFLFEQWVSSQVELTMIERAAVWAAGATLPTIVLTVGFAMLARHFGQPGTDSFLSFIGYENGRTDS